MGCRRLLVQLLIVLLCASQVPAGLVVTGTSGITATGADGIVYYKTSGITATGADGWLAFGVNGITTSYPEGITATGADGVNYTGTNGITATGVATLTIQRLYGITATGADGFTLRDANGTSYPLAALFIQQANGITATGADGITATGADGITATGADARQIAYAEGITATGADVLTITEPAGITATGADGRIFTLVSGNLTLTTVTSLAGSHAAGLAFSGADGITATGADAQRNTALEAGEYAHADGITATGADRLGLASVESLTAARAEGFTITDANQTQYRANTVVIRQATGITATGADGITATGADGITATGADALRAVYVNGITATGADSLTIQHATGITATGADGRILLPAPGRLSISSAAGFNATGIQGLTLNGARALTATGLLATAQQGLQSVDPELALTLNQLTDDSNLNAALIYYRWPTEADLNDLRALGILGGVRYRVLPVLAVTATKAQLLAASRLPAVRALYGNRSLQTLADPGYPLTGADRARTDADLMKRNGGLPVSGRGVTVAVLDTGLDSLHADLAGRVVQNVKLAGFPGVSAGFTYPLSFENVPNTDWLHGHGTFVGGVIAGNGLRSGGKYTGVAPGARLLGLSAGDLNLFYVLEGFDYILAHGTALGVRVVNCSFSAATVYDANDPVNLATKLLTERGVSVVISAGNNGPGLQTLNPYAQAPWVIAVGATDSRGRLADFSARGAFGSPTERPALVAPGVSVVSLRSATAPSLTGVLGAEADTQRLTPAELPYYTSASGTSFSAPQVAGAIALLLEANPLLTPAQVRALLQRTATPLPPAFAHESGAGMLNVHAALLQAAFPQRRFGSFRATLERGQARFVNDPFQSFSGTVTPGTSYSTQLSLPPNTLSAAVQLAWGPLTSTNDLGLAMLDPNGVQRAAANVLNLPGLTGRRERLVLTEPVAGLWTAQISHTIGAVATPQAFNGALALTRVEYAPLRDLEGLSPNQRAEIYQTLRSFVMWPLGNQFRPELGVSRWELALVLLLGGRVPQYLPAQPNYQDANDAATQLPVESVQAAPGGKLFPDAEPGGRFKPNERANRLSAAIALVRAAGLRGEAESSANLPLPITDAAQVPPALRGYISVALKRGLLTAEGALFRPYEALQRVELAHAWLTLAATLQAP